MGIIVAVMDSHVFPKQKQIANEWISSTEICKKLNFDSNVLKYRAVNLS